MTNIEIAAIFQDIADLLEIKGENKFKIRAYQNAVETIRSFPRELVVMVADGKDLRSIPGVGEAITKKSVELITTGRLQFYEDLKKEFPEGIAALLKIRGVGPRTVNKLMREGITSMDELEMAIGSGKLMGIVNPNIVESIISHFERLHSKGS
jgi:DNA polymerase (family 10)